MAQRGRKSAASLNVIPFAAVPQQRPTAPSHLSAEQQQIWTDLVAAMKPEHFPVAVHPLLENYCICVAQLRAIQQMLRDVKTTANFKHYKQLLTMQTQQSALLCKLSTRLRLLKPNRSTRDNHAPPGPKPWDIA